MPSNIFVGKNNSKKISELRPRDIITTHRDHSWIPVAQFDSRINAYTNFAINLSAITEYTDAYSYAAAQVVMANFAYEYNLDEWERLHDFGTAENPGYITNEMDTLITYSSIAQNIVTYSFSYTDKIHGWQYLFGHYDVFIPERPAYIYTELEEYINTEDGTNRITL